MLQNIDSRASAVIEWRHICIFVHTRPCNVQSVANGDSRQVA